MYIYTMKYSIYKGQKRWQNEVIRKVDHLQHKRPPNKRDQRESLSMKPPEDESLDCLVYSPAASHAAGERKPSCVRSIHSLLIDPAHEDGKKETSAEYTMADDDRSEPIKNQYPDASTNKR
jgi:hypothetical protein